jgi:hypothetical protein
MIANRLSRRESKGSWRPRTAPYNAPLNPVTTEREVGMAKKAMSKGQAAAEPAPATAKRGDGETTAGYFRRIFKENPKRYYLFEVFPGNSAVPASLS